MRALWALVLCGCDFTFQLDRLDLPPRNDGSISDDTMTTTSDAHDAAMLPGCMPAMPSDDFSISGGGCGMWSSGIQQTNGANASRTGGQLVFSLTSAGPNDVFCEHDAYDIDKGVMIEVARPATGFAAYTQLKISMSDKFTVMEQRGNTDVVTFASDSGSTRMMTAMRWWRMRRVDDTIHAELSADGNVWQSLGQRVITETATPLLEIGAGTTSAGTWGPALIDNLNVCP